MHASYRAACSCAAGHRKQYMLCVQVFSLLQVRDTSPDDCRYTHCCTLHTRKLKLLLAHMHSKHVAKHTLPVLLLPLLLVLLLATVVSCSAACSAAVVLR
jgi:hypothetical protein